MAYLSGRTKDDAILIDDDDDDRRYQPAPRIPSFRPRPQAFKVTQASVDLTKDSDDDEEGIEAVSEAWSAAQRRRKSGQSRSDVGQASPSTPRGGRNSQGEVVSRVAPAKLDLPDPEVIADDEGVAPAWDDEEQDNPAAEESGATKVTSSPSNHFLSGLPQRTKVSQPSKVDESPTKSAPAVATRSSASTHKQPQPEPSESAGRPYHRSGARGSLSASSLVANSSLSGPSAVTMTNEGELPTVLHSHQQPAGTNFAHAASVSGSAQDRSANISARAQNDHTAPQHGSGPELPIGEIADHSREQTTSGRVNIAPTTSRSVEKPNTAIYMPTNALAPQGPSVVAVQRKQRAVKSVRRVETGRFLSSKVRPWPNQHPEVPAKKDSIPQEARQIATTKENSNGSVQSGDRSLGTIAKTKSTDQPKSLGMAAQTLSERAQASSSSGDTRKQKIFATRTIFGQSSVALAAQTTTSEPRPFLSSSRNEILLSSNGLPEENQSHGAQGDCQETPERALSIDVDDLTTARLAVETCLREQLVDRHESHANLTGSQMWRQKTCYEREFRALYYNRVGPRPPALPEKYVQTTSPFEGMSSIQVPFDKTTSSGLYKDISQEVFNSSKPKDPIRSAWAVRPTTYKSEAVRIPPFKEYVFLKDSILADNETKLLATPYLQEDDDDCHNDLVTELPKRYEMKHDTNASYDVRNEQCRFYKGVIDTFLRMIGVSWDSILFWLLASKHEIKQINGASPGWPSFEDFVLDRSNYHLETFMRDEKNQTAILFDRDSEKWKSFWAQLESPTTAQCRLSAIACAAVLKECDFSIWYLARQSETLQTHISKKLMAPVASSTLTFRDIVCRVCHQHNCLLHGELRQVPEDSWKDEDDVKGEEPAHFDSDSDIEKVINYKVPRNPDAFNIFPESEMIESRGSKPPPGKFDKKWWEKHSFMQWEHRKPFFPCNHEGSCEQADCRCFRENITCEKTCKCSKDCQRRFPGCNCASKPKKRLCGSKTTCLCAAFNRECDADLCGTCGAADILDPVNRFNEDMLNGRCTNVAIQRGVPRKTYLGHSEVHGFGLYIGEDVKMDDYIGEYTGETISVSEGDRRSVIYGYQKTMYLFTLDEKQEVDATYMGNKLRFINNADEHLTNCTPKNLLCNTVFRLALYANTDIKAGSELFFHYNYPKEKTKGFKQPKGNTKRKTKKVGKTKVAMKTSKSSTHKSSASSSRTRNSSRPLRTTVGPPREASSRSENDKAKLAEESAQEPSGSHLRAPQKARKTATDRGSKQRRPQPLSTRRIEMIRRPTNPDESHTSNPSTDDEESHQTQDSQSTQEIQETDNEEDDNFSLDEVQDSASESESSEASEEDTAIEDSDSVSMRSTRSRTQRSVPMAQVVAMKKIVKRRPAQKRKRIIINSDDE